MWEVRGVRQCPLATSQPQTDWGYNQLGDTPAPAQQAQGYSEKHMFAALHG